MCEGGQGDLLERSGGRRLGWALLVSTALHAALLWVVPGRSPSPAAFPVALSARLIASADGQEITRPAPIPHPTVAPFAAAAPKLDSPATTPRDSTRAAATPATRHRDVETVKLRDPGTPPAHRELAAASPAALAVIRDPTWYPAKQLDELPRPLQPIRPRPLDVFGDATGQGRVVLQLLIDENGIVTDATVVEAEPDGLPEGPALAAVRNARFRPGSKDGRVVRCRTLIELSYGPRGDPGAL